MALRNIDLTSVIRCICTGHPEQFKALAEECAAKMKECGLKHDAGAAVSKAPKFGGRRTLAANPCLKGRLQGSGDLNGRSLIDWVKSIEPLPDTLIPAPAEGEEVSAEYMAQCEMQAAHENLVTVHATLLAHAE